MLSALSWRAVSDDWMKGELNGRKGIFPSAYVQMQG